MHDVTSRLQFNGAIDRVGQLKQLGVPAYTQADASLEFALTRELSVVGIGQNLLHPSHIEFSELYTGLVGSRVPRSGRLQLRWQF